MKRSPGKPGRFTSGITLKRRLVIEVLGLLQVLGHVEDAWALFCEA